MKTTDLDALESTYREIINALGYARRNGLHQTQTVTDEDVTRDEYAEVLGKINSRTGSTVEVTERDLEVLWDALATLKLDFGRVNQGVLRAEVALMEADKWAETNEIQQRNGQ